MLMTLMLPVKSDCGMLGAVTSTVMTIGPVCGVRA